MNPQVGGQTPRQMVGSINPAGVSVLQSLPSRLPRQRMLEWTYYVLAACCFWNLTGLGVILFKNGRLSTAAIVLSCVYFFARASHISKKLNSRIFVAYFVMIAMYLGVAYAQVQNNIYVFVYVSSLFLTYCAAIATRALVSTMGLDKFLRITCLFMCLGAWSVFLSPFLQRYYRNSSNAEVASNAGRFLGFFTNPNETGYAGSLAAVGCFACLALPRKRTWLLASAIVITGVGVTLTFSRGALATLLACGIGFQFLTARLGQRAVGFLVSGIILFALTYWFFTDGYHKFEWTHQQLRRIQSVEKLLTFQEVESEDIGGRIDGARAGIAYWLESPWTGNGLGTLHNMPDRYSGGLGCHNAHVMLIGESGVIGFTFYVIFLIVWGIESWNCKSQPIRAFSLGLILVFLTFGMANHGLLGARGVNLAMGISIGLLSLRITADGEMNPVAPTRNRRRQYAMPSFNRYG